MGLYRSTTFSSLFRRPEIDIWVSLCDNNGSSLIDNLKPDAIRSLDKLIRVAFDDEVARYARALTVRLCAYDIQTRSRRFHGRDRAFSGIRHWKQVNAPQLASDAVECGEERDNF